MNNISQTVIDLVAGLGMSPSVLGVILEHPYALVFVGLLLGGETVLLPALYFAVTGVLNGWYVVSIMIVATVISDSFWYTIGRGIAPRFIQLFVNEKRDLQLEKLSSVIAGNELVILFYSKFIYGTRIAAQILCGARKVVFFRYLSVNVLAVSSLGVAYYALVYFSVSLSYSLGTTKLAFIGMLAIIAACIATLHFSIHSYVKRKWFQ